MNDPMDSLNDREKDRIEADLKQSAPIPSQADIDSSLSELEIRNAPNSDAALLYALCYWRDIPNLRDRKLVAIYRKYVIANETRDLDIKVKGLRESLALILGSLIYMRDYESLDVGGEIREINKSLEQYK